MPAETILDTPIPRNETALMQHLLRLVGVERHRYYISGSCPLTRLAPFLQKMTALYPLTRNKRGRTYDRHCGRAAVHLIVYPLIPAIPHLSRSSGVYALGDARAYNRRIVEALHAHLPSAKVVWWIVSGDGKGGLNDPAMPDHQVMRDAMRAEVHIEFGDYVLLYAHKKEPREIIDRHSGRTRTILKDTSTWTWKLRGRVFNEVRVALEACCARMDLGREPGIDTAGTGLRGLLAAERSRPLFSGVRSQVLDLERHARTHWRSRVKMWRGAHPIIVQEEGDAAGQLKPIARVLQEDLPKKILIPIYADPPLRVRDILPSCMERPDTSRSISPWARAAERASS
jgi:hypothetical protein